MYLCILMCFWDNDSVISLGLTIMVPKEKYIKVMEAQLETYRVKHGGIKKEESDEFVGDGDYQPSDQVSNKS
ncbi:hypothetical protein Hanom_Chr15g01400321 [Helianthus anomalus]